MRGSEMNLDGLDAMEVISPPRQTHHMLTRCARPPFRFHPQRVGTSSDPALARVAGDKTAPVRDERQPGGGWAKARCSHAVLGARNRRRGRRVLLTDDGSARTAVEGAPTCCRRGRLGEFVGRWGRRRTRSWTWT